MADIHPLLSLPTCCASLSPDGVQVGCKELRSQRYLSDGLCTSVRPITEVLCTGHCVPPRQLPWYAQFVKVWARTKVLEWRCVTAVVRHQRVSLLCDNGDTRTYRVRVVKACKCKRYMSPQNRTTGGKPARRRRVDGQERRRRRRRRRRRKEERRQAARHQDL